MEQILKIAIATIFGLAVVAKLSGKTKETFEQSGRAMMYATAFLNPKIYKQNVSSCFKERRTESRLQLRPSYNTGILGVGTAW